MSTHTHPNQTMHPETQAIHAGKSDNDPYGSLATPIYQTSTYVFDNTEQGGQRFAGEQAGYIYGRLGNPTVRELEQRMAALEGSEDCAAMGSGMGAIAATVLALVEQGDHIIASSAIYGCTLALFEHQCSKFGIEVTFVDMTNTLAIIDAIQDNSKLIFAETPANPTLTCIDLEQIAKVAQTYHLTSIIDNTFMTPMLQRPLQHGIDIVVHSATKYLNGHGDVIAGLVCANWEIIEKIKMTTLKDMGAVISPNDAWLIIRGLKTLHVRLQRHCQNATHVTHYLTQHPQVKRVYYPGLADHDGHVLIGKQMAAAGGVIAFELKGSFEQAVHFMDSLKLCKRAVSLGDAETLIQHPASMTHSPYTPEQRQQAGISDHLIRLSVGLEHVDDIINDLSQALQHAFSGIKKAS